MPTMIAMPKLGMSMREGTVVSWPIALGGRVEKGQPVVVIESEKAEIEIEATQSGVLRHIYTAEGETVPCGTLLGAITDSMDEPFNADAFHHDNDRPEKAAAAPAAAPRPALASTASAPAARTPVAPAARALARRLGIEVADVLGSGPGGRVTKEDIEAYAKRRETLVEVAPGVRLEVLRAGAGDPVLLLPGFGSDVSAFASQTRKLIETHRVIGVNPRGVGLSDAPQQPQYDVATAAADAGALLSEATHVVGASLGAAVAIELALRFPERVRSLTLITPFVAASPRLRAVLEAWCQVAAQARPETVASTLMPWLFSSDFLAAPAADRTRRGLAATCANVAAPALRRNAVGLLAWSGSRSTDLAVLRLPTLVLAAGADLLTPDASAIAAAIPQASLIEIAGAGHALSIEAADAVTTAILAHFVQS